MQLSQLESAAGSSQMKSSDGRVQEESVCQRADGVKSNDMLQSPDSAFGSGCEDWQQEIDEYDFIEEEEDRTCMVCDVTFESKQHLRYHQRRKRHYGCSVCDDIFPSRLALEFHKENNEHWTYSDDDQSDDEDDDEDDDDEDDDEADENRDEGEENDGHNRSDQLDFDYNFKYRNLIETLDDEQLIN